MRNWAWPAALRPPSHGNFHAATSTTFELSAPPARCRREDGLRRSLELTGPPDAASQIHSFRTARRVRLLPSAYRRGARMGYGCGRRPGAHLTLHETNESSRGIYCRGVEV